MQHRFCRRGSRHSCHLLTAHIHPFWSLTTRSLWRSTMSPGGGRGFLSAARAIPPLQPLHREILPHMKQTNKGLPTSGRCCWGEEACSCIAGMRGGGLTGNTLLETTCGRSWKDCGTRGGGRVGQILLVETSCGRSWTDWRPTLLIAIACTLLVSPNAILCTAVQLPPSNVEARVNILLELGVTPSGGSFVVARCV